MSAKNQLLKLQFIQLDHDKCFHPDILSLPVQRRICHMALHFAKYAGKLTLAKQNHDRELLLATLVDAFIICLTVGNMFNKQISDLDCLKDVPDEPDVNNFARKLIVSEKISKDDVFTYAAEMLTIEAGKIAKAVESLDHLEDYPYKKAILDGLNRIVQIVLVSFSFADIDLFKSTCARLETVEKKSIFYPLFRGSEIAAHYKN
jgi:hypothetical protein